MGVEILFAPVVREPVVRKLDTAREILLVRIRRMHFPRASSARNFSYDILSVSLARATMRS